MLMDRWRYGVLKLLPSITAFKYNENHSRHNNPFEKDKVLCCHLGVFIVAMVVLFNIGLVVGLVMVANAIDGGNMSDKNPFVLSIPFLVGAVGFVLVVTHCCLRCCWQIRKNKNRSSQQKKVEKQVRGDAGEVTMTTNTAKQLARTTSAMPQVQACCLFDSTKICCDIGSKRLHCAC